MTYHAPHNVKHSFRGCNMYCSQHMLWKDIKCNERLFVLPCKMSTHAFMNKHTNMFESWLLHVGVHRTSVDCTAFMLAPSLKHISYQILGCQGSRTAHIIVFDPWLYSSSMWFYWLSGPLQPPSCTHTSKHQGSDFSPAQLNTTWCVWTDLLKSNPLLQCDICVILKYADVWHREVTWTGHFRKGTTTLSSVPILSASHC